MYTPFLARRAPCTCGKSLREIYRLCQDYKRVLTVLSRMVTTQRYMFADHLQHTLVTLDIADKAFKTLTTTQSKYATVVERTERTVNDAIVVDS